MVFKNRAVLSILFYIAYYYYYYYYSRYITTKKPSAHDRIVILQHTICEFELNFTISKLKKIEGRRRRKKNYKKLLEIAA